MSSAEEDLAFGEKHNEAVQNGDEIFERTMCMPTLPSTFKSLVGRTVKIDKEEPRCVIELLGDLLGITDYKINKAAFWFLDTVALHVLRYKNRLDDHYRGVLISWLAGEIILIRDKRLLREEFFKEMKLLFLYVAEKLSKGDQFPHWELLVDEYFKTTLKNPVVNESNRKGAEYSVLNDFAKNSIIVQDEKRALQENKYPFLGKDLKFHDSGHEVQRVTDLQENLSNNFPSSIKKSQIDTFTNANAVTESSYLIDSNILLDVIIEATYNMYANELRYALIHAVFVMLIPIEIHHLPALRIPRRIKLADLERSSLGMLLHERLKKMVSVESKDDIKKYKGKKNNAKGRAVNDIELSIEVPPTPVSSLSDEEMLAYNRQFILPLIEAREAAQIFGIHADDT